MMNNTEANCVALPNCEETMLDLIIAFLKEPLVIPVYSALVAVVITLVAQWFWERRQHNQARKHALIILKAELERKKLILNSWSEGLGGESGNIYGTIDLFVLKGFLNGSYVSVSEDTDLIFGLHEFFGSISVVTNVFKRIEGYRIGMIDQSEAEKALENEVKKFTPTMIKEVQTCLNEIDTKLREIL